MLEKLNFRMLFEATSEALIISNEAGEVLTSNKAAQTLLGYSEDELTGMLVEKLMPERYRKTHHQYRNAYIQHPEKRPMGKGRDLVAITQDGRELEVRIGLSPIYIENTLHVLITLLDATLERAALRAKEESSERLRLAQHAVGFGVFDLDLVNDYFHWDEQAKKVLGRDTLDIPSYQRLLEFAHPLDAELLQQALNMAIDGSTQGEYKVRFRVVLPRDGGVRWVDSHGRIIPHGGKPARLVGIIKDVTHEVFIEEQLDQQRAETEALLRRQIAGQTASAIAHELNQPLAAVSAYGEIALRELETIDCPQQLHHAIVSCHEQSQRAGNALHELLEFLRSGEVDVEAFELKSAVLASLSSEMKSGLTEFETQLELDENLPPVLANKIQVQKVITNLIRNAVEAVTGSHSNLRPILTIISKQAQEAGMAELVFKDNGPGLAADSNTRIFEPFFTTKTRGIGMGLAVSRSLIRANGGDLWAESASNTGAVFHLTLPLSG